MLLKALELTGFKSFPDLLRVDFHPGVTAIVGPNGAGKSNISDAIRWVLGEQSAKSLRGGKMEDVIFAGAESRKRMGYAEVSLTLDNTSGMLKTDYAEVTVTRRYYRSGESEYFLNKKAVRLKDINELFMDTGIGRDGYSVIGQGRIDEILSVRAQDRREIFDEAAGITKYRYRKEEAEKKLSAAQDNLTRIGDLMRVMEERLEPLEKQAEKEKTYNALRAEQRSLEVGLWLHALQEADAQFSRVSEDLTGISDELQSCGQDLAALDAASGTLTEKMRALEGRQENLRELQTTLAAEDAAAEGIITLKRTAIERNLQETERLKHESTDLELRAEITGKQLAEQKAALAEKRASLEMYTQKEISAAEALAHGKELRAAADLRREENRKEAEELQLQDADVRVAMTSAESTAAELTAQLNEVDTGEKSRESAALDAKAQLDARHKEMTDGQEGIESLQNVLAGYERLRASRASAEEAARDAHTKLRIRMGDLENRARLLRELERDYEGYAKATRAVLQRRDNLGGIHGPVSSLIRVDDAYVAAVETALGSSAGHIVVDREEDARRAIMMLKSRNEGRATFLPLSAIRGTELSEREVGGLPGFIGVMSRLVGCDEIYRAIVRNLMGRTVVIDNIDHAIDAARKTGHRYRLVTLDGQVLSPGGAMTGGSLARSTGVLSRANELARVETELSDCGKELTRASEALSEAQRENVALAYRLDGARTELTDAKEAQAARVMAYDRAKAFYETLTGSSESRDAARQALENRLRTAKETVAMHDAQRGILRERMEENIREGNRLEREFLKASASEHAASEALETLRRERAAIEGSLDASQAAIAQLEARLTEFAEDRLRRGKSVEDFDIENAAFEREITAAENTRRELAEKICTAKKSLDELLLRKQEVEALRVETERKKSEVLSRQMNLEREKVRLENRQEMAKKTQDDLTAQLWNEYELTRATAMEQAEPLDDLDAAKNRADAIRKQIRALGNVYTGAIEEFAQLSERYTFYTTQRDDAETSCKQLTNVIAELQKQMRKQFSEQFDIINRAFGETFNDIFGGGTARVELEDPSDVLASGIEIKVQLPGKTLKVLSLLSGGERAFVAIALFFAILRVRPSPFCILDEIDAALDDVNVQRFARYLRKFTDHTQFIVITHRRHTMEEADMLYGVAMPVQGVSKLLAFDVKEAADAMGL